MAQQVPQTYANHVRFHPPFHYFLAPASFVVLILSVINVVRNFHRFDAWILLLIGILFPVAVALSRINALRVQDRLIRLEERLRLQSLLPQEQLRRIEELTVPQLIALRFACDEEVAALAAKALDTNMKLGEIKKAIVTWRADTFRV